MSAPVQDVHREPRRIRELQEEYLVTGNLRDARGIVAERKRVKTVECDAEVRMIGCLHD